MHCDAIAERDEARSRVRAARDRGSDFFQRVGRDTSGLTPALGPSQQKPPIDAVTEIRVDWCLYRQLMAAFHCKTEVIVV